MTTTPTTVRPSPPRDRARAPVSTGSARSRPLWPLLVVLTVAVLVALAAGVSYGTVSIPFGDVWAITLHALAPGSFEAWWTPAREAIVMESRLPRVLTAAAVGACLAVAGGVAQAVTRNPLADPYLLGVSSGASFGVVCLIVLGFGAGMWSVFSLPVAAFCGAMLPLFGTLLVSHRANDTTAIVLVGAAMTMVFSALVTFVLLVLGDEHQLGTVMHWIAGGFGGATWQMLLIPVTVLVVIGTIVLASSRRIDLLLTGDDGATALGLDVARFRIVSLLAVSLLTAGAVSVSGSIGFVGLLVPHLAGYLVGRTAARLLPTAAILGALVMVLADLLTRAMSDTTVLPVGVVTGLVGGPVFLAMLWHRYGKDRG